AQSTPILEANQNTDKGKTKIESKDEETEIQMEAEMREKVDSRQGCSSKTNNEVRNNNYKTTNNDYRTRETNPHRNDEGHIERGNDQ
ncbi:14_t:CDS:1, partial [Ambispora leptoticha]